MNPHTRTAQQMMRSLEAEGPSTRDITLRGMVPPGEIETGTYLHRDDVVTLIRSTLKDGCVDLPPLATAVPEYIATLVQNVGG